MTSNPVTRTVFPYAVVAYDEDRSQVLGCTQTVQQAVASAATAEKTKLFPRVGWVYLIQPVVRVSDPDLEADVAKYGNE